MERTIYIPLNKTAPCVRLLNATHQIGCHCEFRFGFVFMAVDISVCALDIKIQVLLGSLSTQIKLCGWKLVENHFCKARQDNKEELTFSKCCILRFLNMHLI